MTLPRLPEVILKNGVFYSFDERWWWNATQQKWLEVPQPKMHPILAAITLTVPLLLVGFWRTSPILIAIGLWLMWARTTWPLWLKVVLSVIEGLLVSLAILGLVWR